MVLRPRHSSVTITFIGERVSIGSGAGRADISRDAREEDDDYHYVNIAQASYTEPN